LLGEKTNAQFKIFRQRNETKVVGKLPCRGEVFETRIRRGEYRRLDVPP
jgi:hypothetical protein